MLAQLNVKIVQVGENCHYNQLRLKIFPKNAISLLKVIPPHIATFVLWVSVAYSNRVSSVYKIGAQVVISQFSCSCVHWSRLSPNSTNTFKGLQELNMIFWSLFLMVCSLAETLCLWCSRIANSVVMTVPSRSVFGLMSSIFNLGTSSRTSSMTFIKSPCDLKLYRKTQWTVDCVFDFSLI